MKNSILVADEVMAALRGRVPVVALETSVIAQGLPFPHNLEAARACFYAVGNAGAVPAAIGVIAGQIRVGLLPHEVERLADPSNEVLKLGSADLAFAIAQGRDGGTTVSATCEIASRIGISVFATGGIGGVHRGVADTLDISQDLWALSRFPVAVVCSGAKIVLDLPKTVEALETAAVSVVGIGTGEFPAFYSAQSGIPLVHRVETPEEAARLVRARFALGQGGIVFAQPPPSEQAFPFPEMEALVQNAITEARRRGITGKAVTPFLLSELARNTQGRTVGLNIKLLASNATFAGQLAGVLAKLADDH